MSSQSGTPELANASTETSPSQQADGKSGRHSPSHISPDTIIPHEGPPRPYHFLARGYGVFTPLIPLDEFPSHIKIPGWNSIASFTDLVEAGGSPCHPAIEQAREKYEFIIGKDANEKDGADSTTSTTNTEANRPANIPSNVAINARLARALDGVGDSTDTEKLKTVLLQLKIQKSASANQRYNPTTPGVLGQKVYCTHWMRTGECDFTQQGCMFLHAMPDLDTLELLGFRSYPRWFREMPRQYQLQNATDFNEVGLDQHRHSRAMFNNDNWQNQGNKYTPPRGPTNHGFPQYQQQQIPLVPGSVSAAYPRQLDSPWRNPGFQAQQPAPSAYSNNVYEHTFSPMVLPHMTAAQPYYPAPEGPSIWSRDTSPNMGIVNRLHKPLSPAITSSYPAFGNLNQIASSPAPTVNQARSIAPAPNHKVSNIGNKFNNANPKVSTLFKVSTRGRGREPRRTGRSKSPKTTDQTPAGTTPTEAASTMKISHDSASEVAETAEAQN